jgi:hypothetical protein
MQRILVAGFALVLLILALLLLFHDGGSVGSGATPGAGISSERLAPAGASSAEGESTASAATADAASESTAEERRALLAETEDESSNAAVTGWVDLTAGCSEDPTLEVFALASEKRFGELSNILDDTNDKTPTEILSRAHVDARGQFRLAWPKDRTSIHVGLRGRFLYLERTVPRRLEESAPLALVPEAGALLKVALRASDGEPLGKVEVRVSSESPVMNPGDPNGGDFRKFVGHAREDGTVEFRALPVGMSWQLMILPEHYAAQKLTVPALARCDTRAESAVLEKGGAVAGHVVGGDDQPIADAKVSASWRGRFFGFDKIELRNATTDEKGAFRIDALPAGEVSLVASREGLLESLKAKVDVPAEGTLDGVVLKLTAGSAIAGRVTWPEGRPAVSANVKVSFDYGSGGGMGFLNGQRGSGGSTKTDEQGGFRVTGLGKGPFVVDCQVGDSIVLPESNVLEAPLLEPPGADPSSAEQVEKTDASARSTKEPVHRARASGVAAGTEDLLLVLHPPAGLWGRAVDQSGAPVSDFDAMVVRQSGGGMFSVLVNERPKQHFTQEQGNFFFENLDPGSWELEIHSATHATLTPVAVELPSTSESDPLVVTLSPTSTVAGIVLSPHGEAVAGATVHEARGSGGIDAIFENRRRDSEAVKTDEQGRFRYEGLLPGVMTLHAESADWARGPTVPLELVGGETITDVELHLLEGGVLTGEVYDAEGKAAPGRMVTAQLMVDFQQRMTTTDSAGTFRLERLPPGSWQAVSMDANADWTGGEEGFDAAAMMKSMQLAQVTIVDGQETHVVLGGLGDDPIRVHGRVTHLGEPYRGAMLTFFASGDHPLDAMKFTTVDDQGDYEITVEGAGSYIVSIAKLTGQPGQQSTVEFPCDVPAGPECRLDFSIPHSRISGRVFGPSGEPVSGARVTLVSDGVARTDSLLGGQYTEVQTDAGGRYDIGGLRPGTYRVSAGGAALMDFGGDTTTGRQTRGDLHLGEEQWLQEIDFHLDAPGTLEVLVRDANGSPAPAATVFVRDGEGRISEAMSFHQTDGSGMCEYAGLAPGTYTALARLGSDASTESAPISVRTGETARVDVNLGAGAILWVRFKLDEGDEVPAHVQVTDGAGRDVTGLLGMADIQALYSKGGFSPTEYRVGPLAPGKYKVHAWTDDGKEAKKNVVVQAGEKEQRFTLRLGSE